jgi:chromosome partitioning protein
MRDWSKRVLLIDLDPQFNASQYLLGAQRYETQIFKQNRPTVWDIFEQAARTPGLRAAGRNLSDTVFPAVRFTSGSYINLIPSQLELRG